MNKSQHYGQFDAPDLAPVIACERTATGWRGLTEDGEILNVHAHINGSPVLIPERIAMTRSGQVIGYHAVAIEPNEGVIADYVHHLDASSAMIRKNEAAQALAEIDVALSCARTFLARYNRAMILLQLGRWQEGFDELTVCESTSPLFMRPQFAAAITAGFEPWLGEDLAGKKLLLIHDHGFGDTLMMLRCMPLLRAMGAEVVLQVPAELERLAKQVVRVTRELVDADYVCSILMLLAHLGDAVQSLNSTGPYLQVDETLQAKWAREYPRRKHKRIGVAWSVGVHHERDYPRSMQRELMVDALASEAELIAVQQSEAFQFEDFADCAALMSVLDEIVTVDTAAVHLAGAIGHPCITLMLSHWASWRWQLPLYRNLLICQQDSAGNWESAFAARRHASRAEHPAD